MLNALTPLPFSAFTLPALVASADDRAQRRFFEFFAVTIRNPHTRRAYARAAWRRSPRYSRFMSRPGSSSSGAR
jgi:hypothetical protein